MSDYENAKTYALFSNPLNKNLISELKERKLNYLLFPQISTEKTCLDQNSRQILENLAEICWIIFPDVFAVNYFIEALRELGVDLFELDSVRICAAGEAVADRLRFVQVHADIIPARFDQKTIFEAISEYEGKDLNGMKILIAGEFSFINQIRENLQKEIFTVSVLPVYQAKFLDEKANVRLKALLKGGAVDEFIFSMPEDLKSLEFIFPGDRLSEILDGTKVSATTDSAFQVLVENDLLPVQFHSF